MTGRILDCATRASCRANTGNREGSRRPGVVQHNAVGGTVRRNTLEGNARRADCRVGDVDSCSIARCNAVTGTLNGNSTAASGIEARSRSGIDVEATGEVDDAGRVGDVDGIGYRRVGIDGGADVADAGSCIVEHDCRGGIALGEGTSRPGHKAFTVVIVEGCAGRVGDRQVTEGEGGVRTVDDIDARIATVQCDRAVEVVLGTIGIVELQARAVGCIDEAGMGERPGMAARYAYRSARARIGDGCAAS